VHSNVAVFALRSLDKIVLIQFVEDRLKLIILIKTEGRFVSEADLFSFS